MEITGDSLEALVLKDKRWSYDGKGLVYRNTGYVAIYTVPDWDKLATEISENYSHGTEEEIMEAYRDAVYSYRITSWG